MNHHSLTGIRFFCQENIFSQATCSFHDGPRLRPCAKAEQLGALCHDNKLNMSSTAPPRPLSLHPRTSFSSTNSKSKAIVQPIAKHNPSDQPHTQTRTHGTLSTVLLCDTCTYSSDIDRERLPQTLEQAKTHMPHNYRYLHKLKPIDSF